MPAGRPSKYNKAILAKANEYLKGDSEDVILSVVGLACYLEVTKKTIYNWSEENEEFLHTLGKINGAQELSLLNRGVTGEFNSTIAKLMLANHGYHDKQDTNTTATVEVIELRKDFDD